MTDPIADLLTRIRNALAARHATVRIPCSQIKLAIVDILKKRGFIEDWQLSTGASAVQKEIEVALSYFDDREPVIRDLKRVSVPGCRIYHKAAHIRPVLRGRGVAIYSTPKGVFSGEEAKKLHLGGEILCQVW